MNLGLKIDIQLFAEEKRQPATPRRRKQAREKGQVAFSQDLTSAVSIFFTVLTLKYSLKFSVGVIMERSARIWSSIQPLTPTTLWVGDVMKDILLTFLIAVSPVMGAAVIFGVGTSLAQIGFMSTPNLLLPDIKRLNPLDGLKRIFTRRTLQSLIKSVMKAWLIGLVTWNTCKSVWSELSSLIVIDLMHLVPLVMQWLEKILINSSILLVLIGVLDYVYQWWEHEKTLKMTHQEIKEEMKDIEGKPEVRQAIRQRQRQIAMRRMMQEIPAADVILKNPTHYAVGLKYHMEEDFAPKVVAKGLDELALRILRVAEENDVYVVEDPPLTRALYYAVDVGDTIPEELYQAVAQVLAYVYRLSGRTLMEGI